MPAWVFPSLDGHGAGGAQRPARLQADAREAELRQIRIHDLRHTFASLLLQHGESVVYVKEQLGHASIQITRRHLRRTDSRRESGRSRIGSMTRATQPSQPPRNRAIRRRRVPARNGGIVRRKVVSRLGIEPRTRRLRVCCSAN